MFDRLQNWPVASVVIAVTWLGCGGPVDKNSGDSSSESDTVFQEDTQGASNSDSQDSESLDSESVSGSGSEGSETGSNSTNDDTLNDSDTGVEGLDADSDGWLSGEGLDCNDSDSSVFPGAPEQLGNNVDDDCDGQTDENVLAVTDSDGDGLSDWDEIGIGTNPNSSDSDGDGTSDLVEVVAGTNPLDNQDNPEAHGNFVFLVPWQQAPSPENGELRFKTSIAQVDLYFLEDISVSMSHELAAIHDNMVEVLDALTCDKGENAATCAADCPNSCGDGSCNSGESVANCPADCLGGCGDGVCVGNESPLVCPADCSDALCGDSVCCGDGFCDDQESPLLCPSDCPGSCGDSVCHAGEQSAITGCINDLWSGAGALGTASPKAACGPSGAFPYKNLVNLQPDPTVTQTAVPDTYWGKPCWEPGLSALFYMATGYGTASAQANGYVVPPLEVPEPQACPAGYRGYPCFRPASLPIVLLIGDEPFSECYLPDGANLGDCLNSKSKTMATRDFPIVSAALASLGAKVVGIKGSGTLAELTSDLEHLGVQSGSVDENGEPFVFAGADAQAADAITDGIKNLTMSIPLDMLAQAQDDPSDSVDAVAAFVDYLEVYGPGTAECLAWPTHDDPNADSHDERYLGVKAGLPVCWKLVPKQNTTVPALNVVQVYRAQVQLLGDALTVLDTRIIYFVVPPVIGGPT